MNPSKIIIPGKITQEKQLIWYLRQSVSRDNSYIKKRFYGTPYAPLLHGLGTKKVKKIIGYYLHYRNQ